MKKDNTIDVFFSLVRAGLWEQDIQLAPYKEIDFNQIYQLAEEQSVVGLVAAGIEHIVDVKIPQVVALQFVGQTLQLEQSNSAMNSFIGGIIEKMRKADIYALLVKGQGIAQCYERPLWRACGDVDFLLSEGNYTKAKELLIPLSSTHEKEGVYGMHLGMTIESWVVELHGSLRCGLSKRMDKVIAEVQNNVFYDGNVRSWQNGHTQVFIASPDNDVIFIFTHFLKHFYKGGLGLRQICDWCRLLWTYRDSINEKLLSSRLHKMKLMSEWLAFGAFAVDYLGMPAEAMPLYSSDKKWLHKAEKISGFIMEVGNFGHNRDMSFYGRKPYFTRKMISMKQRIGDLLRHSSIFPVDSIRFFPTLLLNGLRSAANGE